MFKTMQPNNEIFNETFYLFQQIKKRENLGRTNFYERQDLINVSVNRIILLFEFNTFINFTWSDIDSGKTKHVNELAREPNEIQIQHMNIHIAILVY